jgi:hypothetical protein
MTHTHQRSPSTACQKQVSALLPLGVPRRRGLAASSFATDHPTSLGDVKPYTIGDHVEPSSEGDLVVRPLLLGSMPISGQPGSSACLPICSHQCEIKPYCPNLFR